VTLIEAQQLALGYNGHTVIDHLEMVARPGELVGLVGPNGAGKTTVLRALAGLLKPRGGSVLVDDRSIDMLSSAARARSIGLIPQGETYVWPLKVEELVLLGRAPHRGWLLPMSHHDHAVVEQALAMTQLVELRHRPIDKLSGGERQRVMIARALAQEPQVLLLDEPTANLDVHHQLRLLDLVRGLVDARKLTAIVAIHDLALAARYCDRLMLLHQKRSYATGRPEEVLTPENLQAVFGIDAQLYRDPRGEWALSVHAEGKNHLTAEIAEHAEKRQ
jgi:iron complex transport system ATP-binding protein